MVIFDIEVLNHLINSNNENELKKYVSEKMNIHNERLRLLLIDEFETKQLIIDKKTHFAIILNNSTQETITINGITFQEVLYIDNVENIIIDSNIINIKEIKFIVFEDRCKQFKHDQIQIDKYKRDTSNNIFIIEDKDIINYEECDYYIEMIENFITNQTYDKFIWQDGNNVNCNTFVISDNTLNTNKFTNKSLIKKINNKTTIIFNKLRKYLKENYELDAKGDAGFQFRKIFGATRIHTDGIYDNGNPASIDRTRIASVIICLNDDYEGGEFYFPIQDITIKLKKGQVLVFPPFWTHPHLTMDLKNRTYRYTINSWMMK
tara:strand:- start:118 stop:1077 length:960 start_codon:yes stop_codon:yes gene_type:complete